MIRAHIDHAQPFDFGQVSADYARYRDLYPEAFYERILSLGLCTKGQRVLDLGTGTGVLPRHLVRYGASFTGIDLSPEQIEQARQLSQGLPITYVVCAAETAPFAPSSFDVVTACQCFTYFDAPAVAQHMHRLLKERGRFLILQLDWLPAESPIAQRTEELVLRYNPAWTGGGRQRAIPQMPASFTGLFETEQALCFDLPVSFTRESWNGRIKTCRGMGASALSPEQKARFEAEHLAFLATQPASFEVLHTASMLCLRKKTVR